MNREDKALEALNEIKIELKMLNSTLNNHLNDLLSGLLDSQDKLFELYEKTEKRSANLEKFLRRLSWYLLLVLIAILLSSAGINLFLPP